MEVAMETAIIFRMTVPVLPPVAPEVDQKEHEAKQKSYEELFGARTKED
jgi:hypothetical protein